MRARWILVFAIVVYFSRQVYAIPTFARKYRTSCNTCHVAIPKLTAFGESFRLNGYQIPEGDAAYVKEEPVSLGAKAWRRVWPNAVWPGEIPGFAPISVRVVSDFKVNDRSSSASTDFDFPHEIELLMAGLLGENIPFFTEIEFEPSEEEWAVEGWLGFYNLFGETLPERALNLKIGSFAINPLPMAYEHLKIGKEHYLYGDWRLSDASAGANSFRMRGAKKGLELNGILASRFWYGLGIVNGVRSHDKDFYFVGRYKYGGTPFDRSAPGELGESIGGKASGFWVDNALEIAGFGYFGSTEIGDEDDDFWRAGVGIRSSYQNLDLAGGFIWGKNEDPFGSSSSQGIDSQTWFIEANYVFKPWLICELRYEVLQIDEPSDFAIIDLDRSRWVPGVIFQIRPNIKLVAEGLLYHTYQASSEDKPDGFVTRLDFAF